jgi:hypothetical protein
MEMKEGLRVTSDLDPIRRSHREAPAFNRAWLRDGSQLTWLQRVGFAVFSLFFLGVGLYADATLIGSLLHGPLVSVESALDICLISLASVVFLIPGAVGLRNVLRF